MDSHTPRPRRSRKRGAVGLDSDKVKGRQDEAGIETETEERATLPMIRLVAESIYGVTVVTPPWVKAIHLTIYDGSERDRIKRTDGQIVRDNGRLVMVFEPLSEEQLAGERDSSTSPTTIGRS